MKGDSSDVGVGDKGYLGEAGDFGQKGEDFYSPVWVCLIITQN